MSSAVKDIVLIMQTPQDGESSSSRMSYIVGTNLEIKPFPHPKRSNNGAQILIYLPPSANYDGDIYSATAIMMSAKTWELVH